MKLTVKKNKFIGKRSDFCILPNNLEDTLSQDAIFLLYIMFSKKESDLTSLEYIQELTGWAKQKWDKILLEVKQSGYVNVHQRKGIKLGQFNYTLVLDENGKLPKQEKRKRTEKKKVTCEESNQEPEKKTNFIIDETNVTTVTIDELIKQKSY